MEIDGIGWNVDWVRKHTKAKFIQKVLKQQHYKHLSPSERVKAIENVYNLITAKPGPIPEIKEQE
jgi:hypothetical protein